MTLDARQITERGECLAEQSFPVSEVAAKGEECCRGHGKQFLPALSFCEKMGTGTGGSSISSWLCLGRPEPGPTFSFRSRDSR